MRVFASLTALSLTFGATMIALPARDAFA